MIILKKRHFRLDLEWSWKELGLGCIFYKPLFRPFPRKCFWIGLSIRLLWLGISIKSLERRLVTVDPEIYDQKQRMTEISAFHHKELIVCKDKSCVDVNWQWNHYGMMIFNQPPKTSNIPGCFSVDILWLSVLFNYGQFLK